VPHTYEKKRKEKRRVGKGDTIEADKEKIIASRLHTPVARAVFLQLPEGEDRA
jgi:hypothetical protein